MMPAAPAPGRTIAPVRRRVLLIGCDANAAWLRGIASRPDLELTVNPAAGDVALAVLDRTSVTPADLSSLGLLHLGKRSLPILVLLPSGDVGPSREALFAAGASDVLFLPNDAERLEETLTQLADLPSRRHPRFRVRISATVAEAGGEREATLENLSQGGAQIRLTSARPGEVLRLGLQLGATGAPPVEVWGLVRVVAPAASGVLARIRFVGLRPPERALLEHFLDSLDAVSRTIEPVEALPAIGRMDRGGLAAALAEGVSASEWLSRAAEELSPRERRALLEGSDLPWAEAALIHVRALAMADVLEHFDPLLDDDPTEADRESVIRAIDELEGFRASFGRRFSWVAGSELERTHLEEELEKAASRLQRAVSARLPDLALAYDYGGSRTGALRLLDDLGHLSLEQRRRLKHRLVAVAAGLTLSGALIYTVAVLVSRG